MDDRSHIVTASSPLARVRTATLLVAGLALAAPAGAATPEVLGTTSTMAAHELGSHPLRALDGSQFTLTSLRGQVVVVNFWASWCAPCRRELPRLDALNTELVKSGGRVVAVSIDADAANARRFVAARKLAMPVAQDGPDGLARTLDLRHVPCTLVLDRDGSIACAVSGSDDAAFDQITAVTRRLLSRQPAVATGGGSETP
ncbi:MAG: TlpA family protein disulfide reductase [Candidatus Eisenbacteria bacterium]